MSHGGETFKNLVENILGDDKRLSRFHEATYQ